MQVWDCEDLQLGEVQDQARRLYCPMMAVPAGKDSSDLTAAGHAAVEALYPQQASTLQEVRARQGWSHLPLAAC